MRRMFQSNENIFIIKYERRQSSNQVIISSLRLDNNSYKNMDNTNNHNFI